MKDLLNILRDFRPHRILPHADFYGLQLEWDLDNIYVEVDVSPYARNTAEVQYGLLITYEEGPDPTCLLEYESRDPKEIYRLLSVYDELLGVSGNTDPLTEAVV